MGELCNPTRRDLARCGEGELVEEPETPIPPPIDPPDEFTVVHNGQIVTYLGQTVIHTR